MLKDATVKLSHCLTQSLRFREALLGDQHPDVAASLNNLAELYYAQNVTVKQKHCLSRH
jgi:hypothetical protein